MPEGEGNKSGISPTSAEEKNGANFDVNKDRAMAIEERRDVLQERTARFIDNYVERRIIALEPKEEEYDFDFCHLSTAEKVILLHEDLVARYEKIKEINEKRQQEEEGQKDEEENLTIKSDEAESEESVDPYILAEIKALWSDAEVKKQYLSRYAEAKVDAKLFYLNETGLRFRTIDKEIKEGQSKYESIVRSIRQNEGASSDKILSFRRQRDQLMRKITKDKQERRDIFDMKEKDGTLPPLEVNTDVVANIEYDKIVDWSKQAKEGFVWMDALDETKIRILDMVSNYRMPILIGESRVGKSELSRSTFLSLTGYEPEVIPCDSQTSEADIIGLQGIDPKTGGDTIRFGKAAFAATGYEYSTQETPTLTKARGVLFDEIYRLNPQKGFSAVKSFRQWRTGRNIYGKPILPNAFGIGTTNPPGIRYPNHHKPEVALQEEFGEIRLDYLPNTAEDPQGYLFILAELMDKNGLIPISKKELALAYETKELQKPNNFPDEESNFQYEYSEEQLILDNTDKRHGFVWRLACAARSIQDAFNFGNPGSGIEVKDDSLRYQTKDGKINVSKDTNDEVITLNSTINAGEIAQWCQAFRDRFGLENETFHTETLTAFMQSKLESFVNQIPDEEDRDKMRAIMGYYHLFDAPPSVSNQEPPTPKEIGYLSPRVPRPIKITKIPKKPEEDVPSNEPILPEKTVPKEVELNTDTEIVLESGETILIKEDPVEFTDSDNKIVKLFPHLSFTFANEKVVYGGIPTDSQYDGKVAINIIPGRKDEALYKLVSIDAIKEQGSDFWPFEQEELSVEKLKSIYEQYRSVFESKGITKNGQIAPELLPLELKTENFSMPTAEQFSEHISSKSEKLKEMIALGLVEPVIVPIAADFGIDTESGGEHSYSGLLGVLAKEIRTLGKGKKLKGSDGTVLPAKREWANGSADPKWPIYVNNVYQNMRYSFKEDDGTFSEGLTQKDFIQKHKDAKSPFPGFAVYFKEKGDLLARARDEEDPLQEMAVNRQYQQYQESLHRLGLTGSTAHAELIMLLSSLQKDGKVSRDWNNEKDAAGFIGGNTFQGSAHLGRCYWGRYYGQFLFNAGNPDDSLSSVAGVAFGELV